MRIIQYITHGEYVPSSGYPLRNGSAAVSPSGTIPQEVDQEAQVPAVRLVVLNESTSTDNQTC